MNDSYYVASGSDLIYEEYPVILYAAETEVPEPAEVSRPFLTTEFEDYTVTEGLLLVLVLLFLFSKLFSVVKGAFSWLR